MANCPEIQNQKPDFNAEDEDQNFVANYHFAKACPTHGKEHLWTKDLDVDFFCCTCGQPLISVGNIPRIDPYEENGAYKTVWLPRRDQLQIMSGLGWEQFDDKCFLAADRYLRSKRKYLCADEISGAVSKERAGIMVVMHELFKKAWDGSGWNKDVAQ